MPLRTFPCIRRGEPIDALLEAVNCGSVLPKGHDGLVDQRELLKQADTIVAYCQQQEVDYDIDMYLISKMHR